MKKLIAQRPILHQGRTYARGDAVPAYDDCMVQAWLRAGSAQWQDTEAPEQNTGEPERNASETEGESAKPGRRGK